MKKTCGIFLISFAISAQPEKDTLLIPCAEAIVENVADEFAQMAAKIAEEEVAEATEYLPQLAKTTATSSHLTNIGQAFGQGIIMAGGSLSQTIISQQDQQLLAGVQRNIQQTEQDFQGVVQEVESKGGKLIQEYSAQFGTKVNALQSQYAALAPNLVSEITTILQLINLNIAPSSFIPSVIAIPNDVAFSASIMNTPHEYPWYNIYQVGDWQYDQKEDTFYQRSLVPINCSSTSCSPQNIASAEFNSIFTELFLEPSIYTTIDAEPNKNNISTVIEMTIYNVNYPFFAGIQFNKTRWISGNLTRSVSYRALGLYATSSKTAGFYTAQTTTSASQKNIAFTQPITPLQKIIQQTVKPFFSLPPPKLKQLAASCSLKPLGVPLAYFGGDPVTFYIRITTHGPQTPQGLDSIAYGITIAADKNFNTILATYAQKNDDPVMTDVLTLYQGIGFMAPGCQASFKILELNQLV